MLAANEVDIYTVSRLNNEVRLLLEESYPFVWVEGEISNFAAPNSGHWYFSLKDSSAQVRCALFRTNQRKLGFLPKDGMQVLIRARVSLYPNRGDYQLIADHIEERGEGKLRRAYEELKKKLETAGLFDPKRKKLLPAFPKQIGIITSATGAAIRDILTVLRRRFPCLPIVIYPTLVQGATAAPTIVKAIQIANHRQECDVLILARGGGSLEDLWPFNEESVAHAIYASEIPIVSGIGHQVDFTIADFVADVRAATPSAAAEIVSPDKLELLQTLIKQQQQLSRCIKTKLVSLQQHLIWMQKHLAQQHPKRRLLEKMQRVDFCELQLAQLQMKLLHQLSNKIIELDARLQHVSPLRTISQMQGILRYQDQQLKNNVLMQLNKQQSKIAHAAAKLETLSPLATLSRGFAIVTNAHQQVLMESSSVQPKDKIKVKLSKGSLVCEVEEIISR